MGRESKVDIKADVTTNMFIKEGDLLDFACLLEIFGLPKQSKVVSLKTSWHLRKLYCLNTHCGLKLRLA